ncbi:hypothetical protein ACFY0B_34570 [Streptomyces sp. NPDC001797]|uniref:hypothetical protein n=1 Tax=Streptomyces sp. NPDC001797 TaxID=3364610 RepID=UPI0036AC04FD
MTTAPVSNVATSAGAEESGDGIWFAVPPGFIPLPLAALVAPEGSAGAERLREDLTLLLDSAPDEKSRQEFFATLTTARRMLRSVYSDGTVHCALGLHRDDTAVEKGSALLSLFTVTWVDTSWAPRGVTAARVVLHDDVHTNIEYGDFPSGPASFSERSRTPTAQSGFPQQSLLQIHGYLPHPDGTTLALLTLSTTAASHREQYREILRQIARTVTFEDPFATDAGGERS